MKYTETEDYLIKYKPKQYTYQSSANDINTHRININPAPVDKFNLRSSTDLKHHDSIIPLLSGKEFQTPEPNYHKSINLKTTRKKSQQVYMNNLFLPSFKDRREEIVNFLPPISKANELNNDSKEGSTEGLVSTEKPKIKSIFSNMGQSHKIKIKSHKMESQRNSMERTNEIYSLAHNQLQ